MKLNTLAASITFLMISADPSWLKKQRLKQKLTMMTLFNKIKHKKINNPPSRKRALFQQCNMKSRWIKHWDERWTETWPFQRNHLRGWPEKWKQILITQGVAFQSHTYTHGVPEQVCSISINFGLKIPKQTLYFLLCQQSIYIKKKIFFCFSDKFLYFLFDLHKAPCRFNNTWK